MNYRQTIAWLFQSLPMYQRIGDAAIKKDLTNIRLLCDLLDQPQHAFASIHVAGTNGKGSTSHMLAAVFQAAGLKTGLYTSPHYVDFRERIKINGRMIAEKKVLQFVDQYKAQWSVIQPSFFEITVAMAFDYFSKEKVDIAIIETGLGGRLDSTNIIQPKLSVITNIGFDHMQMLGYTLPAIAYEKAGIIKPVIPAVIGEWHAATAPVFKQKAIETKSPLHFASRHIKVEVVQNQIDKQSFAVRIGSVDWFRRLTIDLAGAYQARNTATVLETLWCWNKYYPQEKISDAIIRKGLGSVRASTQMIGRWMVLEQRPIVIADAAHNEHGIKAMLPDLLTIPCRQRHFVLGFVGDKEIDKILSLFPADGIYYWCAPNIPRGKPVLETKSVGDRLQLYGKVFSSAGEAYKVARKRAVSGDLVFIGGSSYVVGDLLAAIKYKTDA